MIDTTSIEVLSAVDSVIHGKAFSHTKPGEIGTLNAMICGAFPYFIAAANLTPFPFCLSSLIDTAYSCYNMFLSI